MLIERQLFCHVFMYILSKDRIESRMLTTSVSQVLSVLFENCHDSPRKVTSVAKFTRKFNIIIKLRSLS